MNYKKLIQNIDAVLGDLEMIRMNPTYPDSISHSAEETATSLIRFRGHLCEHAGNPGDLLTRQSTSSDSRTSGDPETADSPVQEPEILTV